MPKQILPSPGVRDELGSAQVPWEKMYVRAIFDDTGRPAAFIPIDASAIGSGLLNPDRISSLNAATIVEIPGAPLNLAELNFNALIGASNPVGRINAGVALIDGSKIAGSTLSPNALNPAGRLDVQVTLRNGAILSDNYVATTAGWILSKTVLEINQPTAVWRGILAGLINIASRFKTDISGNTKFGDQVAFPNRLHGIDNDGKEWWGSDEYVNAPCQIDAFGNFYLTDSIDSLSSIDLGAIDPVCNPVQPSQAGGLFNGNLTLTPLTRGAKVYYTSDGTNPDITKTLYTAPFGVHPTLGNPVTIKAVAYKFGIYSAVTTWVFDADGNSVAAPTFSPIPSVYTTSTGTMLVSLLDGTAGATIRYTIDGSTPSDANGIIYTGPITLPAGYIAVKAYAKKAGLTSSAVVTGPYTILRGGGQSGGSGGHLPPP